MKLIHKLLLGFLATMILTWIVGLYSVTQSKFALQKAIGETSVLLVQESLDMMDRIIYYRIEEIKLYSKDKVLQQYLSRSNQEFDAIYNLKEYIAEKDKEWKTVPRKTITPFMHKLIGNQLSDELKETIEFYENEYGYKVYGEIFVTNKYGANVGLSGKTSDYYQGDEEWWQAAKKDGIYISDVVYDESAEIYSLNIAIRVNDKNGNFLGVMKSVLNIEEVINILKGVKLEGITNTERDVAHGDESHDSMHFELLNKNGKLLFSTEVGENHSFEYIDEDLFLKIKDKTSKKYFVQSGDRPREGEELLSHAHSEGYSDFKGLGWILLAEHDRKQVFAPATKLMNQIITVCIIITVIGLILSFFLATSITKSIAKLRNAINKIGEGKMDTVIDVKSKDEIGQLAKSFAKMTFELKTTTVNRDELFKEIEMRKRSDKMLHDSEERFRSVAENANDAIIYIDGNGEVIFWNKSSENIFGYLAEEIVGQSVFIIIPERLREAHKKGIERVKGTGGSNIAGQTIELIGLKKNGNEFPLEMSVSTWKSGGEAYFTSVIRDITQRKQAEKIIKNQVSRLSALRSIDKAIISSLDLDVTLDVFLAHVKSELKIDAAAVLLCDHDTQLLEYKAGIGFQTNALKHTQLRMGESHAGRSAKERNIINIPNLKEEPSGFERSLQFSKEGFISYFAIPLIAKGVVLGVIEIFHRSQLEVEPDWIEFFEAIADQGAIALDNSFLFNKLQSSNVDLSMAYDRTLEGWSRALDMRDRETEGHSQRVTEMAVRIAHEFQITGEELQNVRRGALLHDIGKMGIPDSILLKPDKLTEEEWVIMKLHPVFAYDLLYPIEFLRSAIDIPLYHHEKWDGTGYPKGLKGEEIPLAARIFAVVDVWDALMSDRPYRPAWPKEKVIEHISSLVGIHFDAGVVEMVLAMMLEQEEAGA